MLTMKVKACISNDYESTLRSRIWITGQINDGWKYTGMLQNTQDLSTDSVTKALISNVPIWKADSAVWM